jgi:hypothetical protein
VRDVFNLSDVFLWVVFLLEGEEARVRNHVRVCHNPVGRNHPTRAGSTAGDSRQPWLPVVWFLGSVVDPREAFLDLARGGRPNIDGVCEEAGGYDE